MTCDHRMGYAPAASEDFNGLLTDDWWMRPMGWECDTPADACDQPAPRRWVGTQCMTQGDRDAQEQERAAGHLGLPLFHVEQPGVLVYCGSGVNPAPTLQEMHEAAAEQAKQMAKEHEARMHAKAAAEHARESRLGLLDFAPGGRACGQSQQDVIEGMQGNRLRKALQDLKAKEDLVRSAPPMSRAQYEEDLRSLLVLRDNVERESRRCPPPAVLCADPGVAGQHDALVHDIFG